MSKKRRDHQIAGSHGMAHFQGSVNESEQMAKTTTHYLGEELKQLKDMHLSQAEMKDSLANCLY